MIDFINKAGELFCTICAFILLGLVILLMSEAIEMKWIGFHRVACERCGEYINEDEPYVCSGTDVRYHPDCYIEEVNDEH